jgi:hypothetical protein
MPAFSPDPAKVPTLRQFSARSPQCQHLAGQRRHPHLPYTPCRPSDNYLKTDPLGSINSTGSTGGTSGANSPGGPTGSSSTTSSGSTSNTSNNNCITSTTIHDNVPYNNI